MLLVCDYPIFFVFQGAATSTFIKKQVGQNRYVILVRFSDSKFCFREQRPSIGFQRSVKWTDKVLPLQSSVNETGLLVMFDFIIKAI